MSLIKRYVDKIKDTAGTIIAAPYVARKKKEAKGFDKMAKLIRYGRETKGSTLGGTDSRDPNFRRAMMASSAEIDAKLPMKERQKAARRIYANYNEI